jgi:hypothetical protein
MWSPGLELFDVPDRLSASLFGDRRRRRLGRARREPGAQAPRDPGRSGLKLVLAAAVVAVAVAVARRWPEGSVVAVSPVVLWVGTAVIGLVLLLGFWRCLASVLRTEGDEARARLGLVLGVFLVGGIALYGLGGGFEPIALPEGAASAKTSGDPYVEESGRYVHPAYAFSFEGPGPAKELPLEERGEWDLGLQFLASNNAALLTLRVMAREEDRAGEATTVVTGWLEEVDAWYAEDGELLAARLGRLNGHECMIARSRQTFGQARLMVFDCWVPGEKHVYLVRGISLAEDWPYLRGLFQKYARSFECW